jgi:hypothetical protein
MEVATAYHRRCPFGMAAFYQPSPQDEISKLSLYAPENSPLAGRSRSHQPLRMVLGTSLVRVTNSRPAALYLYAGVSPRRQSNMEGPV